MPPSAWQDLSKGRSVRIRVEYVAVPFRIQPLHNVDRRSRVCGRSVCLLEGGRYSAWSSQNRAGRQPNLGLPVVEIPCHNQYKLAYHINLRGPIHVAIYQVDRA